MNLYEFFKLLLQGKDNPYIRYPSLGAPVHGRGWLAILFILVNGIAAIGTVTWGLSSPRYGNLWVYMVLSFLLPIAVSFLAFYLFGTRGWNRERTEEMSLTAMEFGEITAGIVAYPFLISLICGTLWVLPGFSLAFTEIGFLASITPLFFAYFWFIMAFIAMRAWLYSTENIGMQILRSIIPTLHLYFWSIVLFISIMELFTRYHMMESIFDFQFVVIFPLFIVVTKLLTSKVTQQLPYILCGKFLGEKFFPGYYVYTVEKTGDAGVLLAQGVERLKKRIRSIDPISPVLTAAWTLGFLTMLLLYSTMTDDYFFSKLTGRYDNKLYLCVAMYSMIYVLVAVARLRWYSRKLGYPLLVGGLSYCYKKQVGFLWSCLLPLIGFLFFQAATDTGGDLFFQLMLLIPGLFHLTRFVYFLLMYFHGHFLALMGMVFFLMGFYFFSLYGSRTDEISLVALSFIALVGADLMGQITHKKLLKLAPPFHVYPPCLDDIDKNENGAEGKPAAP